MVSIFKSVLQESTEAEAVAYLAQVSPPFARSLPSFLSTCHPHISASAHICNDHVTDL